ncbi:MAG: RHS repeat-associated core domain-containing protein, partial [Christensenellaceae bacterium]|nr:RHS repeat-associated core domain-containing protein [Christensenellaceae bacterium]
MYMTCRTRINDAAALIDNTGQTVVQYRYDSRGKLTSISGTLASSLGHDNPFRYRGYYYDKETGFYYVSSRYYDPEIGRWINADNQLSTGSD